jgi:hypothetical protein
LLQHGADVHARSDDVLNTSAEPVGPSLLSRFSPLHD